MNFVDLILGLIMLFAVWAGYTNGFITATADLIKWIGSIAAGFYFYQYAAELLEKLMPENAAWNLPLAFLVTIILVRIILSLLLNAFIWEIPAHVHESRVNRLSGMLPGLINGLITATIIAVLLLAFPIWDGLSEQSRNSKLTQKLSYPAEWMQEKLSPVFNDAVDQTMTRLTVHPGSDETVKLPYTSKTSMVRPDLENEMLEMVNNERQKEGLKPLQPDPELQLVARNHSKDMLARGYFSHFTPERKDPFDRMKEAKVKYITAGENLALAQTLFIAHNGLMKSPGHRANILNAKYGRIGIGIQDAGIYGLMISQEFRN